MMETAEKEFLISSSGGGAEGGPFIRERKECGLADIHAIWMLKWALHTIDVAKEPGFGKQVFPKVHAWCDALPTHDDEVQKDAFISAEDASKQLLASAYACPDVGVDASDPLGLREGEEVAVEMTDATPGTYPQNGKLIGLSKSRVVLELENGLRLHFPRVGYVVNRTGDVVDGADGGQVLKVN